jgi:hypothetical protein
MLPASSGLKNKPSFFHIQWSTQHCVAEDRTFCSDSWIAECNRSNLYPGGTEFFYPTLNSHFIYNFCTRHNMLACMFINSHCFYSTSNCWTETTIFTMTALFQILAHLLLIFIAPFHDLLSTELVLARLTSTHLPHCHN